MKKLFKFIMTVSIAAYAVNASALEVTPFAGLLVWQASQQSASSWANVIGVNPDKYTLQNDDFGWDPGFRGGLSFDPKGFFDTKLYWTYFTSDTKDSIPLDIHLVTPEFFSGFLSDNDFFGAKQEWKLDYHTVDLELSHAFNITDTITLRPIIGVKAASINQTIDVLWQALLFNSTEKVTSNYLGIGPSFGVNGAWQISKQLEFVSEFAGAFMWGRWNIKDTYKRPYEPLSLTPNATTITTKLNDSELGTLNLRYFVGLHWSPQALSRLSVEIGYDMQYWANQLRVTTFQQLPTHGDLTLQGGTCSFSFDFY